MLANFASAFAATPTCPVNEQGVPGGPYQWFSLQQNHIAGGVGSALGASLAGADASTFQALEILSERRALSQAAEICPSGFTRIGGTCQPIARPIATR
jgi:hypothetical protein